MSEMLNLIQYHSRIYEIHANVQSMSELLLQRAAVCF